MTQEQQTPGTLLWVGGGGEATREAISTAARQFGVDAHFCSAAEVYELIRSTRCDMLGIELGFDSRTTLATLREIHERLPRLTILAASEDTGVPMIRAALESGASDFLSLPLHPQELQKALIKFTQLSTKTTRTAVGEIITVCGARGGLGVTTIAVNLAVRLANLTHADVGLVDLDLQRGDVAAFLNLTPSQSIAAIPAARGDVDEIFLHGILTRHTSGVFVLPAPSQIEEADIVGHDDVKLALHLLRTQFRYTVVDTPRTITGATLAAFEDADRVLVLTDLSVPGVRAAQRMFELLKRMNTPPERIGLLVTQAIAGPVELKEAVRTFGKDPLLVIPRDDTAAGNAMNSGSPLNGVRQVGLSQSMGELAARLAGVTGAKASRGHLLRRFFGKETRT